MKPWKFFFHIDTSGLQDLCNKHIEGSLVFQIPLLRLAELELMPNLPR